MTFEEAGAILDETADALPSEMFSELNGGISLLPDTKMHPKSIGGDLFILGEYHCGPPMGRYITIYFGSFRRVFGNLSPAKFARELKKTLYHELVHHMESLACTDDLEREDENRLAAYCRSKGGRTNDDYADM